MYYLNAIGTVISWTAVFMLSLLKPIGDIIDVFSRNDRLMDKLSSQMQNPENTFDFIVVGGGSAGAVVVNRLSEDYTVLLLEAGGEPSLFSTIPSYSLSILNQKYVDWQFRTEPQKNACFAMNNQSCIQSKGLGLGGSSNLNFMIYLRGHPKDFDTWAKITGDPSWSYEKVLPFFKKSEDFKGKFNNPMYHSHGGNLQVSEAVYGNLADHFVHAGIEMGYREGDLNSRNIHNKFSKVYFTMENGRSCGTAQAFIEPVRKRRTLTIYKFARAYKDHIVGYIGPFLIDHQKAMLVDRDVNIHSFNQFVLDGEGPLTSSGAQAVSLLVSSLAKAKGEVDWPDIQFILSGLAVYNATTRDFEKSFNVPEPLLRKFYSNAVGKDSFFITNVLSRPKTRGEITLHTSNPYDYPIINPNYLSQPEDIQVLIEGAQLAVKLVENTAIFQSMGGTLSPVPLPGCESREFRSDEYWECFHRHLTLTLYDSTGTCAMGKKNSTDAVVDSQLRVIGTKSLRVIDASVMPTIPVGNLNAATIMIGEMGSHLIKTTWSPKTRQ